MSTMTEKIKQEEMPKEQYNHPTINGRGASKSGQLTDLEVSGYKTPERKYNPRVYKKRDGEESLRETLDYINQNPGSKIEINYSSDLDNLVAGYVKNLESHTRVKIIPETNLGLEIYCDGEWVGYIDKDHIKNAVTSLYNEITPTNNLPILFGE